MAMIDQSNYDQEFDEIIGLKLLAKKPYVNLLCYPKPRPEDVTERLRELRSLKVDVLMSWGEKKIGKFKVLGKGCVGIVLKGRWKGKTVAVKVRRVDADRVDMSREAEMLQRANLLGVGPKLLAYSKNLLIMEYIRGQYLDNWLLEHQNDQTIIKKFLRDLFTQCNKLDIDGLDHGELSNASKHVIISDLGDPVILDFESASCSRKTSNLTSLAHYILIRPSSRPIKLYDEKHRHKLIKALGDYKRGKENVNSILRIMGFPDCENSCEG